MSGSAFRMSEFVVSLVGVVDVELGKRKKTPASNSSNLSLMISYFSKPIERSAFPKVSTFARYSFQVQVVHGVSAAVTP